MSNQPPDPISGYPPPAYPPPAYPLPAHPPGAYPPPAGDAAGFPQPPATYPTGYGPPSYPTGYGPPPYGPVRPSALPTVPRPYQQMLRGPRHRWWRPLLSLLLASLIAMVLINLITIAFALTGAVLGVPEPLSWVTEEVLDISDIGPVGFAYVNLALIALIPAVMLAVWAVHRIRPRYVSSIQGRLRWPWLFRCVVVVVPLWAVYLGVDAVFVERSSPHDQWPFLLAMVLVMTPFQAAAEEYFFRGLLTQTIGSWFAHPAVAWVVPTAVSTAAFAAAHGSTDVWIFTTLAIFGISASLLTWRTGGLEAAIVIHAINNVGIFSTVLFLGGWEDAFVGVSSEGTAWGALVGLGVHGAALALVLWQARRSGITREYQPSRLPARV
jgi:membrane protease YdiL (CAAX protease family)